MKLCVVFQWSNPEVILALCLHKFPEWARVVFFKAFLDNVVYVLPPRSLLVLVCGLLLQLKVQPCVWIIAATGVVASGLQCCFN